MNYVSIHTLPMYGGEYTRHMIYNVQKCHHVNVFTKNMKEKNEICSLLPPRTFSPQKSHIYSLYMKTDI